MQTEPIRWAIWLTALTGSAGLFFVEWATQGDWRLAIGKALVAFALPVAGGEVARSKAYAPETANEIMDADAVISAAERG